MRFSAAFRVALAPDSLTIIPPENHFVNTFFIFFDKFFGHSLVKPYNVIFGDFRLLFRYCRRPLAISFLL